MTDAASCGRLPGAVLDSFLSRAIVHPLLHRSRCPVECPRCQAENRQGRRFCAACGTALASPCAACGFANDASEKFCGGCGAALMEAASVAEPSRPVVSAQGGERRQVTVLYADVVGYSKLSREIGPEETRHLLNRFFEVVDSLVQSHGGDIDKHIGDAVMARFGAPVAHSNDPERAVLTALAIQAAMGELSRSLGRSIQVHIGIASGLVVASGIGSDAHREYTVTGETVNLASRLHDLAGAGETLIADTVYRSVSELFECESLGEAAVKGWARPVALWRLHAVRGGVPLDARIPFVGRHAELTQFNATLVACRDAGRGETVFLRGEAGIGKTRLAREFSALAEREGFVTHRALVLDFGVGTGQDAVRALMRSLLDVPLAASDGVRSQAVANAMKSGLVPSDHEVYVNDLLDLPQPTDLRALYDAMDHATRQRGRQQAVVGLVRSASARGPLLAVVEDIHWASQATLGYLAAIAATIGDIPAILLLTSRIEGDPLDKHFRSAARGSRLVTVDLAPLRHDEAIALAAPFVETSQRMIQECVERADGNPLFLEQLLRNAEESRDEPIPASIQSLVLARLDRLPQVDKQALQAASVIGQRFGLALLRYLIEDQAYACDRLVEQSLVRPDGEDFLFDHALVQEAVYFSLLGARQRALHARAAAWFAGRDHVLSAQHLERAEDPRAARAYFEAAEAESREYRYERALQLTKRGLERAGGGADQYALACLQGDILRELGMTEKSVEAFKSALAVSSAEHDKCRAYLGLAAALRVLDRYDEALTVLQCAEAAARDDLSQLSQVHYLRGNIYFPLGRIDGCREQHALALRYARASGSAAGEAQALSGLADAEYLRGRMATACDHFRGCVALARTHALGRIEVVNRSMIGFARYYLNELRGAVDDGLAAVDAGLKVGHQRAEMLARFLLYMVLFDLGEIDDADVHLRRGQALAESLGARRFVAQNRIYFAKFAAARADRRAALRELDEAWTISSEVGHAFAGPRILSQKALLTVDTAARREALAEGEALLRGASVSHNFFWFYRDAIEASLEAADWDEVNRYAQALEDYTRPEPLAWCQFFIARGRALAKYGRGQREPDAMAQLRQLNEEAERAGFVSARLALLEALEVPIAP
ncbi:MAG TPA: adenylate/guanylate cyclase domain-containing protein [Casimicrobiaceae bacterium]|nr:adenylate/guanylate cyclase domain-containing protein [Casimicrobiaceae bacterium]